FREEAIFETIADHLGLEYLFEDAGTSESHLATPYDPALTAERVAALPRDMVSALRAAIGAGDVEEAGHVAEAIRAVDEPLAIALLSQLRTYRIDDLFALL